VWADCSYMYLAIVSWVHLIFAIYHLASWILKFNWTPFVALYESQFFFLLTKGRFSTTGCLLFGYCSFQLSDGYNLPCSTPFHCGRNCVFARQVSECNPTVSLRFGGRMVRPLGRLTRQRRWLVGVLVKE
jgi:hypothetical protein